MAGLDGGEELSEIPDDPTSDAGSDAPPEPEGEEPNLEEGSEASEDGDGGEGEDEGDGLVDFDTGLETFRVPPKVKDYVENWRVSQTQRDQELAEQRKALETERTEQAKLSTEAVQRRGALAHAEATIEQLKGIDWNALNQNDPEQAQAYRITLDQWKDYRDDLKSAVAQDEQRSQEAQSKDRTKRVEQAAATLARDIPDWSKPDAKGVTLGQKVALHAMQTYGYTAQELQAIDDPRLGKLMHRAYQRDRLAAKQRAAPKSGDGAEPPPQPKPNRSQGRGSQQTGPRDADDIDTWMEKRRKQLAARRPN